MKLKATASNVCLCIKYEKMMFNVNVLDSSFAPAALPRLQMSLVTSVFYINQVTMKTVEYNKSTTALCLHNEIRHYKQVNLRKHQTEETLT